MPRTLRIAAVQMDVTPTSTADRLQRAAAIVQNAMAEQPQLVVLPELFNTGYAYTDSNYDLSEDSHGPTVTWMRQQAAAHNVHLVGTLLLREGQHIYNAALLFAPDGRMWRYDKNFPWGWERAYFREGEGITVAETDIGTFGFLICWDSAHPELWQRYGGLVDAMIIPSCPPHFNEMMVHFPDGETIAAHDLGGMMRMSAKPEGHFALRDIHEQTAWLGVPAVHTSGAGMVRTALPMARVSVSMLVQTRPDLQKHLLKASDVQIEGHMGQNTKIIGADGALLAQVGRDVEGFVVGEVVLPDKKPQPVGEQPKMHTPRMTYVASDIISALFLSFEYRRKLRQKWGKHMAPVDFKTRVWTVALVLVFVLGLMMGSKRDDE